MLLRIFPQLYEWMNIDINIRNKSIKNRIVKYILVVRLESVHLLLAMLSFFYNQ